MLLFCSYLKYVLIVLQAAYAISKVIINLTYSVFQITVVIIKWVQEKKQQFLYSFRYDMLLCNCYRTVPIEMLYIFPIFTYFAAYFTSPFRARVFSNNESFIFYCNNSTSFESVFCMKTVKSRLFKKYLKRRKSRARFCLSLGWLHISEKKLLKTSILLVQELIK